MEKEKIIFLESLRGLAAMIVVLFHFKIGSVLNNSFTENGYLMVDFFFILSGFVIALNYSKRIYNFLTLKNYMYKRFLRLYPLHLFTLLLWLLIEIIKYFFYINGWLDSSEDNLPFTQNNVSSFAMHIFLIQNIFTDQLTWNGPSWSISVEFYTYLLFGLAIIFLGFIFQQISNIKYLILCAFFIFFAVAFFYLASEKMFLRCIYGFFLGSAMFFVSKYRNIYFCSNLLTYFLTLCSVFSMIYVSKYQLAITIIYVLNIYSLLMVAKFSEVKANKNILLKFLSLKPLVFLGSISYGIYMTHSVFIGGLVEIFKMTNIQFFVDGGYLVLEGFSQLEIELLMFSVLGIIISFSYLCYKYIERPFINYSQKISLTD